MALKTDRPLERKLVAFFEGDIEILKRFYPTVGYNLAIRELVHAHCRHLEEQQSRNPELNHDLATDLAGRVDLNTVVESGNE
jgi:hypothetical protein